jgi:hypothetical protein
MNPPAGHVPPAAPRTSGAAIASLILGIIGCLPLVTSILAVILGIIGIRKTADPRYTGRGLAIAGLILGIIGLLFWGGTGIAAYTLYQISKPVSQVAHQFTTDVAAGNLSAAEARCEANVTQAQLQQLADQFKQWGTLQDLTLLSRQFDQKNGQTVWNLDGMAKFSSGTREAKFKLHKQPDGSYKVVSATFQ